MNLTGLFKFPRVFLIQVLTRLSPIYLRYGTRNQILGIASLGSVTDLEIRERYLFLSLEMIDFLMLERKPFHDINLVIFVIWSLRK